jgi:MerR family transcriptional regulator, copper efflux regulator
MMIDAITIGTLADQGGVNLETIRYYERKGLLQRPPRTAAGYRQFPPNAVNRIRFIKRAQGLGFTLAEVKELLALRVDPEKSCHDVEARAREKIADIEQRIQNLTAMHRVLGRLVAACADGTHSHECPILAALERRDAPLPPAKRRSKS